MQSEVVEHRLFLYVLVIFSICKVAIIFLRSVFCNGRQDAFTEKDDCRGRDGNTRLKTEPVVRSPLWIKESSASEGNNPTAADQKG